MKKYECGDEIMSNQLFSDQIFKLGIQLYNKNKVGKVTQKGNLYHCLVQDREYYHVVIAVNQNKRVIDMECSCQNSKNGKRCQHEAAVFWKLHQNHQLGTPKNNVPSIKDIYNQLLPYVDGYPSESDLNRFLQQVNQIIEIIIKKADHVRINHTMSQIKTLLRDYALIDLPEKYEKIINNFFVEAFSRLFAYDEKYRSTYQEWMEETLLQQKMLLIADIFFQTNLFLPEENIYPLYKNLIQNKDVRENDFLMQPMCHYIALHLFDEHLLDLPELLDIFPKNTAPYYYLTILDLIQKKSYNRAITSLKLYKDILQKDYPIKDLESFIYAQSDNKNNLEKLVLSYFEQKQNKNGINYLKKLKKLYGDEWSTKQYDIYPMIKKQVTPRFFEKCLCELEDWQWMIYEVLSTCQLRYLQAYGLYIKNHDPYLYYYLYKECIINEYKNQTVYYAKDILFSRLMELVQQQVNEDIVQMMTYEVMKLFPEDEDIYEALNSILKGEYHEYYNYRWIY